MDSNLERAKRIQKVLERHKSTITVKQDLHQLAEQISRLIEQPVALRQYLEKMFMSGWDNLQEQIVRVSVNEQEDNKGNRDDDDISLGSSSRLSSDDEAMDDKKNIVSGQQKPPESIASELKVPRETHQHPAKPNQQTKPKDKDPILSNLARMPRIIPYARPFMPGDVLPPPPPCPPPTSSSIPFNKPPQSKPKPPRTYKGQSEMLPPGRPKEERKNSLWLKNLPQQYNTIEALAGFFKKYGQIRDIFTTPEASTACVMFYKEQDTLNAYNNSEKVFGKPFIFKTLNADEEPPAQLMTEIKNMELKRKKSEHEEKTKMQLKEMRQQLHSKLSDRYRAILFVYNRLKDNKTEIEADMEHCRSLKARVDTITDDELQNFYDEVMAGKDFDWTITIKNIGALAEDRKALSDMFEKYGRCQISLSDQTNDAQIRFLSLQAVPKLLSDRDQKLEVRFNNDKLAGYMQRITLPV